MTKQRDEAIWDEAYSYGVSLGKQSGLEVAQKQMEKVFKEAYEILNVELRINRENKAAAKRTFVKDLHDPFRDTGYE